MYVCVCVVFMVNVLWAWEGCVYIVSCAMLQCCVTADKKCQQFVQGIHWKIKKKRKVLTCL